MVQLIAGVLINGSIRRCAYYFAEQIIFQRLIENQIHIIGSHIMVFRCQPMGIDEITVCCAKAYEMAYSPNYPVSSYRMDTVEERGDTAVPFAKELWLGLPGSSGCKKPLPSRISLPQLRLPRHWMTG